MKIGLRRAALLCAVLLAPVASRAAVEITLWDFLSGGDGVRWKQMVEDFNKSQSDYHVSGTTLTWGDPFYTRVHVAVTAGETPDVMTYHLSHFPAGLKLGDLRPIPESELKMVGLAYKDFNPALVDISMGMSKAFGKAGVLYGVPLDTHTVVLYYNKDLLKKAGLLGADGKPTGLTGIDGFTAALKKIKAATGELPLALSTANDAGSPFRMWYTLFMQQGGSMSAGGKLKLDQVDTLGKTALQVMVDWTKDGLIPASAAYPASVALFTTGKAAFMFNGNWEVPTMVDMKAKGTLPFDYGVMAFPKLYANASTFADSHELCIPANTKSPISAEKLKGVLTFIAYIEKHADYWAGGGHLPAYLPALNSPALAKLVPVNEYAGQAAKQVTFEPPSPVFGVGGPVYTAVTNFLVPALTGQIAVPDAIAQFKQEVQNLSE
ncbi:MAG TPA: extracellular solute-binding protein [Anaeromyxobacter sp.]|nr:extracellular solute-binding protein [Anaeromyxobacter sp.]